MSGLLPDAGTRLSPGNRRVRRHRTLRWPAIGARRAAFAAAASLAAAAACIPEPASAHAGERGFILLLPTTAYLVGGAVAVLLTFAAMALIPSTRLRDWGAVRWRRLELPSWEDHSESPAARGLQVAVLALGAILVAAGYAGSRDPLANPLPLTVWSLWWVAFTFLVAVFGNLWSVLNPWRGAWWLLTALPGLRAWRERPPVAWPGRLGATPAVVLFAGFAWLELVDPAPSDPEHLANAVLVSSTLTLAGMLLFGERAWLRNAEAFTVFFRMVAWLSPFHHGLALPGSRLLEIGALRTGTAVFVLLALGSVSFDGLSRTFTWLAAVGANPLEHPGRSALVSPNTVGLLGTAAVLGTACLVAILAGQWIGNAVRRRSAPGARGRELVRPDAPRAGPPSVSEAFGTMVPAIVPIAFGYHFAHYIPSFLLDAQFAARALSDPFGAGWNLLGTAGLEVRASVLTHHASVKVIWNLQAFAIVAAHVIAVTVGHALALREAASSREAVLSQIPMTVLMVGYTLLGLWLLSTPAAG